MRAIQYHYPIHSLALSKICYATTPQGASQQLVMVVKVRFSYSSARELKGAVSRVVEVEWAKFTRFFSFSPR